MTIVFTKMGYNVHQSIREITMKLPLFVFILTLFCIQFGCSRMQVKKVPVQARLDGTDDKIEGFRHYLSRPYIVVQKQVPITTEYILTSVHLQKDDTKNKTQVLVSLVPDRVTKNKTFFNLKGQIIAPVVLEDSEVGVKPNEPSNSDIYKFKNIRKVSTTATTSHEKAGFVKFHFVSDNENSSSHSDFRTNLAIRKEILSLWNKIKRTIASLGLQGDLFRLSEPPNMAEQVDGGIQDTLQGELGKPAFTAKTISELDKAESIKKELLKDVGQLRLLLCALNHQGSFETQLTKFVHNTSSEENFSNLIEKAKSNEESIKECKKIVEAYELGDPKTDSRGETDGIKTKETAPQNTKVELNIPNEIQMKILTGSTSGGGARNVNAFDVAFLPDFEEQMAVKPINIAAYGKYDMHFADGWQMHNVNATWDSTEVPVRVLQNISNLLTANAEVEQKRLATLPITPAEIEKRKEELNRATLDAFINKKQIVLITRKKFIEPGVYRLRKWSDSGWDSNDGSSEMVQGMLTEMGLPIRESVSVDLVSAKPQ